MVAYIQKYDFCALQQTATSLYQVYLLTKQGCVFLNLHLPNVSLCIS